MSGVGTSLVLQELSGEPQMNAQLVAGCCGCCTIVTGHLVGHQRWGRGAYHLHWLMGARSCSFCHAPICAAAAVESHDWPCK
jgi:hypothetical protein